MKIRLTPELRNDLLTVTQVLPQSYGVLRASLQAQGAQQRRLGTDTLSFASPEAVSFKVRLTKKGNLKGSRKAIGTLASICGKGNSIHDLYRLLYHSIGGRDPYDVEFKRLFTGLWLEQCT